MTPGYKNNKKWRKNKPSIWQKGKKRYYDKSRKEAFNYKQKWTAEDIDIIMDRKDTDSNTAELIGRSVKAIQVKRARIRKEEFSMNIIFQHLYEEVFACIVHKKFGSDIIIFPQNFIPVLGLNYKNLNVKATLTGEYKFQGKTYHVSRAYHPAFGLEGNPIDKTANVIEVIDFKYDNKDRKAKMGNGFAELSKIRGSLPERS